MKHVQGQQPIRNLHKGIKSLQICILKHFKVQQKLFVVYTFQIQLLLVPKGDNFSYGIL